jgi:hypothetical protein
MQPVYYLLGIVGVWLIVLSVLLFWIFKLLRNLVFQKEKGNLLEIINKILDKEKSNFLSIQEIKKEIEKLEGASLFHVQRIGLVRFNPFRELGGDHSFSLALLDGNEDGFILTGLHTRERTRIYAKDVRKGKSKIELSSEERKALLLAQNSK